MFVSHEKPSGAMHKNALVSKYWLHWHFEWFDSLILFEFVLDRVKNQVSLSGYPYTNFNVYNEEEQNLF